MGLDIFQNGGFVENLKFGRKNRSFLALLEVIFMFSFWPMRFDLCEGI